MSVPIRRCEAITCAHIVLDEFAKQVDVLVLYQYTSISYT